MEWAIMRLRGEENGPLAVAELRIMRQQMALPQKAEVHHQP
jgi:hypothetical protein